MPTSDVEITPVIGQDYAKIITPLIQNAQSSIDVMMYQWKWYSHEKAGGVQNFNLAFVASARRGVKINVFLNIESMGHMLTKINSLTEQHLKLAGCTVKFGQAGRATHAKMIIIDDRILVLGSHNVSKSAFSKNQEVSIIIKDSPAIRKYIDYFKLVWDSAV